MRRSFPKITLVTIIAALPSIVFALGADHRHPVPKGDGGWPDTHNRLFNWNNRVHGFFVNFTDVFYYVGDADALNRFLEACSKLEETSSEVVLHVGKTAARSPWDKTPRNISADWKLVASRRLGTDPPDPRWNLEVHVWLGGKIVLDEIKVPISITVTSAGEIDRFISEHEKQQKV